jgi:DNA-binding transcriptional MerR regulator
MSRYTVTQLARLSGVSVRTLHHYDAIGLLTPAHVGENRYRYYGREELLRLQDILFHRELGIPLAEIGALIDGDDGDRLDKLRRHRAALADRLQRSRTLLDTIDRTIAELDGGQDMADKDFFTGFAPEKQDEYEAWLVDRGVTTRESIDASKAQLIAGGKAGMKTRIAEMEEAEAALAEAFWTGLDPNSPEVTPLLERHRRWVAGMWGRECDGNAYAGMADMYLAHPDFRNHFERHGEGFLDWLVKGMRALV